MRTLPVSLSLLTLAIGAGCAMQQPSTSSMGAAPASTASADRMLYCKDGSYVAKSVGCAAGVERDMTPAAATQKQDKY
jgi:hypothetical protein